MSLEQRKVELINWITTLNNESMLKSLELLRDRDVTTPEEILNLLQESSESTSYTKHTSAKDLL